MEFKFLLVIVDAFSAVPTYEVPRPGVERPGIKLTGVERPGVELFYNTNLT
jgi:hypothetical protein